jgi:hypothetical protein
LETWVSFLSSGFEWGLFDERWERIGDGIGESLREDDMNELRGLAERRGG